MKKILWLCCSMFVLFAACKKESVNNNNISGMNLLSGKVLDENGNPVSGASVTYGPNTSTTDAMGQYSFASLSGETINLKAEAAGYFTAYRNAVNIDGSAVTVNLTMITQTNIGTVSSASGGTAASDEVSIKVQSGGFLKQDGSPYDGSVTVYARQIDFDNPNFANLMPGGDFRAVNDDGQTGQLISFGFIVTEFRDASGNKVTPASGKVTATYTSSNTPAPDAQLWVYNESSGTWSYAGAVSTSGDDVTMPVTGGTYHNCDAFRTKEINISGTITDCDGKPVVTEVAIDNGYAKYTTFTNGKGKFSINAIGAISGTVPPFPDYTLKAAGITRIVPATSSQTVNIAVNPQTGQLCNSNPGSNLEAVLIARSTWVPNKCWADEIDGGPVKFNADHTGIDYDEDGNSSPFSWRVDNDKDIIIMSDNAGSGKIVVRSYTADTIIIDHVVDSDGETNTFNCTAQLNGQ